MLINILFVITKLELGGAQKHVLNLIDNLDKNKYKIFIFTAQKGLLLSKHITRKEIIIRRSIFLDRPIHPIKDLLALIELYFFIKTNKITLIHTHSSKAGILGRLAAKLAKVKIIIHTVHGWSFNDFQHSITKKIYIYLEKAMAKFSHKIIVVSHHDKQTGLNNKIGEDNKYQVIRYGINFNEFNNKESSFRTNNAIKDNELVVGTISCLKPQKCPQDFIKLAYLTLKLVPNIKFILVGDGILLKKVHKEITRFKLEKNIILTGWRHDIPEILSSMDIFVLTSLWEGLPISVLEAMLMSKPVIATDTGGIKEVIKQTKTGFLVKPHDIKNMVEILIALLKNKELREAMGENAKNYLNTDFQLQNMIKANQELYDKLITQYAN
ncbi:MAG: glycosyltransferase family 4 protein [Candidatus Omnitrophota bacterium]